MWLLVALVALVAVYSAMFHVLMEAEGREFSWFTGVYWTLTVMSTLGLGDVTFESDIGKMFSLVVLGSGTVLILILLPFAFIQFAFLPWMARRESARAPRRLPDDIEGHVVVTNLDPVTDALIRRAEGAKIPYVVIVPELPEAVRLADVGYRVMLGALDDPATYRAARVDRAALVASTAADTTNANIAFTVRELSAKVPIVVTATSPASVDNLHLAGCSDVVQLGELLGQALARRVVGADACSHVVGEFGSLRVAEVSVAGTPLAGKRLRETGIRERTQVNVVGLWQRGVFTLAGSDTQIGDRAVLILVGTDEQLAAYDAAFAVQKELDRPVVIIGGGRVGRAAGAALGAAGVRYKIVEQRAERVRDDQRYVHGDAADIDVLERAGITEAAAALVTTHEDDMNVYLTLYCRRLRPDMQIISRAILDRNVSTLHRAGADAVLSYASLGATAIWNTIGRHRRLVLAEGLEMFRVPVPDAIAGRSLIQSAIPQQTGCNVVAIARDGELQPSPEPAQPLPADGELLLIGDEDAEQEFLSRFPVKPRSLSRRTASR